MGGTTGAGGGWRGAGAQCWSVCAEGICAPLVSLQGICTHVSVSVLLCKRCVTSARKQLFTAPPPVQIAERPLSTYTLSPTLPRW